MECSWQMVNKVQNFPFLLSRFQLWNSKTQDSSWNQSKVTGTCLHITQRNLH